VDAISLNKKQPPPFANDEGWRQIDQLSSVFVAQEYQIFNVTHIAPPREIISLMRFKESAGKITRTVF